MRLEDDIQSYDKGDERQMMWREIITWLHLKFSSHSQAEFFTAWKCWLEWVDCWLVPIESCWCCLEALGVLDSFKVTWPLFYQVAHQANPVFLKDLSSLKWSQVIQFVCFGNLLKWYPHHHYPSCQHITFCSQASVKWWLEFMRFTNLSYTMLTLIK